MSVKLSDSCDSCNTTVRTAFGTANDYVPMPMYRSRIGIAHVLMSMYRLSERRDALSYHRRSPLCNRQQSHRAVKPNYCNRITVNRINVTAVRSRATIRHAQTVEHSNRQPDAPTLQATLNPKSPV